MPSADWSAIMLSVIAGCSIYVARTLSQVLSLLESIEQHLRSTDPLKRDRESS
jgi:hypothetical protein